MTLPHKIISAFPATGKSYAANRFDGLADSDSSRFSWERPGVRNPDWPANYFAHIEEELEDGMTVLVSSHAEVRTGLVERGLPFTFVYPDPTLRAEYRERMERRGSPLILIHTIYEGWDTMMRACREQRGCDHIVLGSGEYLSDVLTDIELRDVA